MGDTIQFTRGLKQSIPQLSLGEPGLATNEERVYIGGNNGNIPLPNAADLSEMVRKSNVEITYFISPTGSDSNNGLTSDTAFKTLSHAVSLLPQVINNNVIIKASSGTYMETIHIRGFGGFGGISISGGDTLNDTYIVKNFIIEYNTCHISVSGFKCITTSADAVLAVSNTILDLYSIKSNNVANSFNGIAIYNSLVTILGCSISSHYSAVLAGQLSIVASRDWVAGSGNTFGIIANYGSVVGKGGTQPQGTTAESSYNGGVIR